MGVWYILAALLTGVSSAMATTATPTAVRIATPTPVVCDDGVYAHPALEFDLNVEPPQPVVGDAVTVTVTIRNTNDGFIQDPIVSLFTSAPIVSGNLDGRPYDGTPVSFSLVAQQWGTSLLRAIATYAARTGCCEDCVILADQMSRSYTLSVGETPMPDLVASHAQVAPGTVPSCVFDLAEYIAEHPLPARVCLRNTGDAPAGSFVVDKDGQRVTVDGLAAGVSTCVSGFLQPANVATAHIRLDTDDQIVERREDNNEVFSNVILPPLPPLCGAPTPTPIPSTPLVPGCPGDCDANGLVRVDELVRGVHMALADDAVDGCQALDGDDNRRVTVNELVEAVRAALHGCVPPVPSPTPVVSQESPTPTPTPTALGLLPRRQRA